MSRRALRPAITVLSLVGAGIAGYLTYTHYADVSPLCTSGGCGKVQRSSYAELAGVPVAVLGLAAYGALLTSAGIRSLWSALAGAVVAIGGTAFGGYLLWAQLARIHAICAWCVGNDAVVAVLAVLCALRLLVEPADTIAGPNRGA